MTAALTRLVAAKLVEALDAQGFSQGFVPTRAYRPTYELADLGVLHVTVVPSGYTETPISRATTRVDVTCDVAVQKKLDIDNQAAMDSLADLVQEIADCLRNRNLATDPPARWIETKTIPGAEAGFAPEHIDQYRQFTAVLRVTYALGTP